MDAKEYAKHRGVSPTQISKFIKEGKIPSARRQGRGYVIDPEQADRELDEAIAPDRGGRTGGPDSLNSTARGAAGMSYANARAFRETYAARILKLEFDQKSGRLVDKNELKLRLAKLHMAVRDSLRTVPDRVAPVLAAETDQVKIHAILLKEIGQALEGLQGFDWR